MTLLQALLKTLLQALLLHSYYKLYYKHKHQGRHSQSSCRLQVSVLHRASARQDISPHTCRTPSLHMYVSHVRDIIFKAGRKFLSRESAPQKHVLPRTRLEASFVFCQGLHHHLSAWIALSKELCHHQSACQRCKWQVLSSSVCVDCVV